jgi:hypothetical protein
MKKDPRIASIQRGDATEKCFYMLLFLFMLAFAAMAVDGANTGHLFIGCVVAMAGIHIRTEMRNIRLDGIRRENVEKAERAGLSMTEMYEDVRDLREAVHNMRFKKAPPSQNTAG